MRGVTFKGNREVEIQEFPDPHAGPEDAVLRVRASGLCGSDLHRYRAREPTNELWPGGDAGLQGKVADGPGRHAAPSRPDTSPRKQHGEQ